MIVSAALAVLAGVAGSTDPQSMLAVMPADPAQPLTWADLDSEERFQAYLSPENQVRTYLHGSFVQMVALRTVFWFSFLGTVLIWVGWDILACFLIGIYLWRRGIFLAEPAAAGRLVWIGLAASVPLLIAAAIWRIADPLGHGPELLALMTALPQALAYLGLLLWWSRSDWAAGLQARLRAVGRLALTNYLMQSLLAGFIFYGYGLGLFNQLDRLAGLAIGTAIAVLQLYVSPIWLRHFRLGPVEWLWRSLAAWSWLPIRQPASPPPLQE